MAVDWNLDGVTDSPATAGPWVRAGYKARFSLMRTLMPGKYMIGNIADWGQKERGVDRPQSIAQRRHHRGHHRPQLPPETWGGWSEMMRWYRKTMDAIAEPSGSMFHMQGSTSDYQGCATASPLA